MSRARSAPTSRREAARPAFALPMVIMLVMLATLLIAVMLQRSTVQGFTVKRQMDSYIEHHASRGFQEVLNFWIRSLGRVPVTEVLEDDGYVFSLSVGRDEIRVFIQDAQGSLKASLQGLPEAQQYLVLEPLHWLDTTYPNRPDLVRSVGPISVSAMTAPREVLDAIEGALTDAAPTGALADGIISARADGSITRPEIVAAGQSANLTAGPSANDLINLVTHEPTLLRAIVELHQPKLGGGMRLAARYSGLMQVTPIGGGQQAGTATQMTSSSLFLSWGPMPIE
ncbi:MAG: hypothetical protein R3B68_06435 [Phycisphaerales bacterium]